MSFFPKVEICLANNPCSVKNLLIAIARAIPKFSKLDAFFSPFLNNSKLYPNNCIYYDRKTVLLDLAQGYDYIWEKEYNSKNRNKIRKARKSKYKLIIDNSRFKEFKEIYDATMVELKSKQFYYFSELFFKKFSESLNVEYLFVTNNNTIERGLILLHNRYYSHYHLSGRSSNNDSSLNNLLLLSVLSIKNITHLFTTP